MKKDYIPSRGGDLDNWETNFNAEVDAVATALGIPLPDVAPVKAEVSKHQTDYDASVAAQAAAKSAVSTEQASRKIAITDVRKLSNRMKAAPGFTPAMGNTLKIIGEDSTFDPTSAKPEIKLKQSGENVVIDFNHPREVDGVKIYSKRGSETAFTFLAIDTESPYEDNRANLTAGVAEKREYYAFFFDDDAIIGLQSDVVSISITK
ncbi:MAG: hypothetical protein ABI855_11160 [Bacteroidota bacterium]